MARLVVYPICTDYAPFKALDRLGEQLFMPRCGAGISVERDNGGCVCDRRRGASASTKLRKRRSSADDSALSAGSHFAVACDVRGYAPEEVQVKTVGNDVVVSGQREEEGDDGSYLKEEFTRRFTLPEGVDSEAVTCTLLASGVLTIEAPKAAPPSKKLRVVPISVESAPSSRAVAEEAKAAEEKPESESGQAAPAS